MYLRDIRVLLVEDCPSDVWLMREGLRLAGVPVQLTLARDGLEAIRYLHQITADHGQSPDLVLLDLNLPRKNGREVLAEIGKSNALQTIPVVVVSSSGADEDKREAYKLNAAGFMTKPFSLQGYVDMVREIEKFWLSEFELKQTA